MKTIRVGILIVVTFAVLAFGGVEPWGEAILGIGAVAVFVLWGFLAVRRRHADVHWNWLYPPLLGVGAGGLLQCVFGLSVYPYLTKIELLKWSACVLFFFLMVESFRTVDDMKQFAWFLLIFGFLVSLFAIIQHFTFNGKLYWSVTLPPNAGPFGPFVNRDDFAGFVELTAPLGLALLLFRAWRREHLTLLLLLTIVPIAAVILSTSRGGIIGVALEFVLLLFFSHVRRISRKQLLGATALAMVAGAFIFWLGVSDAIGRFEQLTPAEISPGSRVSMYRDTWQIFVHHPWLGTGLGTLRVVYPRYASYYYHGLMVDHAHNDYLELLADMGVVGGLCGLSFIALLFWRGLTGVRSPDGNARLPVRAGSITACAGLLLHSLVDFNLHIPSNALLFLLLASVATSEVRELNGTPPPVGPFESVRPRGLGREI
jgi:O-antigen ligase